MGHETVEKFVNLFDSQMLRPCASSLHHVLDDGKVWKTSWMAAQVFLVDYNASKLLAERVDDDGESWTLPFDKTVFEFLIGKMPVVVLASVHEAAWIEKTGNSMSFTICARTHRWFYYQLKVVNGELKHALPDEQARREYSAMGLERQAFASALSHFVIKQIEAVCVLLDVGLFETDVVRASKTANNKRLRNGKTPFFDHHELKVKLTRASAAVDPVGNSGEPSVRLHIRRGHWHHFHTKEGKVRKWLKAMWVGDPDLGFVDKIYRLGR